MGPTSFAALEPSATAWTALRPLAHTEARAPLPPFMECTAIHRQSLHLWGQRETLAETQSAGRAEGRGVHTGQAATRLLRTGKEGASGGKLARKGLGAGKGVTEGRLAPYPNGSRPPPQPAALHPFLHRPEPAAEPSVGSQVHHRPGASACCLPRRRDPGRLHKHPESLSAVGEEERPGIRAHVGHPSSSQMDSAGCPDPRGGIQ